MINIKYSDSTNHKVFKGKTLEGNKKNRQIDWLSK